MGVCVCALCVCVCVCVFVFVHIYLTECISKMVLGIQFPHKIVESLFTIAGLTSTSGEEGFALLSVADAAHPSFGRGARGD